MFKKSSTVKEYTHDQQIIRSLGRYSLVCTTFYFGCDRVSWIYHIVVKDSDSDSDSSTVYGSYHSIGDAMNVFNEIVSYTTLNVPVDGNYLTYNEVRGI